MTVLDVRPADEFALGHLSGAVNIQLTELKERLADLDPTQESVAYCILSLEAVAALRASGFKARRLVDGLPEPARNGTSASSGTASGFPRSSSTRLPKRDRPDTSNPCCSPRFPARLENWRSCP